MALGVLRIPVNMWQYFTVTGGPFRDRPMTMKGVKMAAEIPLPCDVDIPTRDYDVPNRAVLAKGLEKAVDLMLAGEPVYAGCFAGKGRTGLFMAVLAKAFGIRKPVEFVRANYYAHAVETDDQYAYVMNFVIPSTLKQKIRKVKRTSWLLFWRTNLTRMPLPDKATIAKAYRRNDA